MIDAHHHLWTYDPSQYPWITPGSVLAQDYLLPDLLNSTDAAGVSGTVVVQARQTLRNPSGFWISPTSVTGSRAWSDGSLL